MSFETDEDVGSLSEHGLATVYLLAYISPLLTGIYVEEVMSCVFTDRCN